MDNEKDFCDFHMILDETNIKAPLKENSDKMDDILTVKNCK